MIEDLPKLIELGALGVICFFLVCKGGAKMQNLTDAIKTLTDKIERFGENMTSVDKEVEKLEVRMRDIDNRINRLEFDLHDEMRNLKNSIETLIKKFDTETQK